METELERRFLLKFIPKDLNNYKKSVIEDIKIITGEPHPHLRLRRKNEELMLTKKYKVSDGTSEMIEETIKLNESEFKILKSLPNTCQSKIRYSKETKNVVVEIDFWTDGLSGLAICEFEFKNQEDASKFEAPEYCLCEITGQEWISTGLLSGKIYTNIVDRLNSVGYKAISLP